MYPNKNNLQQFQSDHTNQKPSFHNMNFRATLLPTPISSSATPAAKAKTGMEESQWPGLAPLPNSSRVIPVTQDGKSWMDFMGSMFLTMKEENEALKVKNEVLREKNWDLNDENKRLRRKLNSVHYSRRQRRRENPQGVGERQRSESREVSDEHSSSSSSNRGRSPRKVLPTRKVKDERKARSSSSESSLSSFSDRSSSFSDRSLKSSKRSKVSKKQMSPKRSHRVPKRGREARKMTPSPTQHRPRSPEKEKDQSTSQLHPKRSKSLERRSPTFCRNSCYNPASFRKPWGNRLGKQEAFSPRFPNWYRNKAFRPTYATWKRDQQDQEEKNNHFKTHFNPLSYDSKDKSKL